MTTPTLAKEWKIYSFTLNGFSFHSRVDVHSDMGLKIIQLPSDLFIEWNKDALKQEIKGEWTRENLLAQLAVINEGGTQAFIELAEESEA